MEGYRIQGPRVSTRLTLGPDYCRPWRWRCFYLFGHLADLMTTIGFLQGGLPECNPIPALVLETGGLVGLIALKVLGALATAWIFWRLRGRLFTVFFTSAMANLQIFVASINSLDAMDALAMANVP